MIYGSTFEPPAFELPYYEFPDGLMPTDPLEGETWHKLALELYDHLRGVVAEIGEGCPDPGCDECHHILDLTEAMQTAFESAMARQQIIETTAIDPNEGGC